MSNQSRQSDPEDDTPVERLEALLSALFEALSVVRGAQTGNAPALPWRDLVHPVDIPRKRGAGKAHLTLQDVCAELDIARSTFYDWRAKGKAPRCVKLPNGDLRIRRSEFDRWMAEREDAA